MTEVVGTAAAGGVFVAVLGAAEATSRHWRVEPELTRKGAHVVSAVIVASLPLVLSFVAVAVLAVVFVPFMVLSRRAGLFPSVHGVERTTLGEVYFPLGVLAAALLFPERDPFAYGILVMGLGDAAAGLVGKRYGRRAYRIVSASKTYMGSAAFFATVALVGLAFAPLPVALLLAAALTLVEAVLGGGADNLVLPVAAAALLAWA
jgi:phytol kinase